MKNLLILFIGLVFFFASCKDKETLTYAEQLAVDTALIDAYLAEKSITTEKTASGLQYVITNLGNNDNIKPSASSVVTVKYKGYFLNGDVFDETTGSQLAQFSVNGVVRGFGEAVTLLNKNGKGTFYLPSGLGYGTYGSGSIAPNTPIVFDVELVDFF